MSSETVATFKVEDEEGRGQLADQHTQYGVKKVELVYTTVSRMEYWVIFAGLMLMSYVWSLDSSSNYTLGAAITSTFGAHSFLFVLPVVDQIIGAVVKLPLAKISDVLGRAETLLISVVLYDVGLILMTFAATNIQGYAACSIIYNIGAAGIYLMQQVIIADLTSLSNRGFWSSIPDATFYINNWVAPLFAGAFIPDRWRLAFVVIIVLMPICSSVVIGMLWYAQSKAKKLGMTLAKKNHEVKFNMFWELDVVGIILICLSWFLILWALMQHATYENDWKNPTVICFIVFGLLIHILFFLWEWKGAKAPLLPLSMLANRTVFGGCMAVFFVFMSWYTYINYLSSFLLISRGLTLTQGTWISLTWSFASVTSSIVGGILTKFTKRYLVFAWIGLGLMIIGNGLLVNLRGPDTPLASLIAAQILTGFGAGFVTMATQVGAQAAVPHQNVGMVTAVYLSIAQFGGALGSIIAGSIWQAQLPAKIVEAGLTPADATALLANIFDISTIMADPQLYHNVAMAYSDVSRNINIASVCVLIPIAICLAFMKNLPLDDEKITATQEISKVDEVEGRVHTVERS
ncbi:hypothetical protein HDV00_008401 [Rhizophlyctis rosea]|nr:hypothetical protein HDV00_008401 [Rhizophlyctis rosea]